MASKYVVAEIPLGAEGMTGTKNLSTVRPTQLVRARNITYENGTVEKEGGTAKYTPTTLGTGTIILAGHDWWPTTTGQRSVIVTSTASRGVRMDPAAAGTYSTTLCTLGNITRINPVFVEGGKEVFANNRKLFMFSDHNPVKVLSGTGAVMTSIASGPADWSGTNHPLTGVVHEGRLWGFMGHRGYYSTTSNFESFTATGGGGSIAIYPGEGEGIGASAVFGAYIVVWKYPCGVYIIDTSDPTVTNWKVRRLTRQIGVASPNSYMMLDSTILFVDISGEIFELAAISEAADVRPQSITSALDFAPWIRENTDPTYYYNMRGIYYAAKRRVELALTGAGSTVNNLRIIMDFNRPGVIRFAYSDMVTAASLWLRKDADGIPRPMAGDERGRVWKLDQATRTHNDTGYTGEVQTPHLDAGGLANDPTLSAKRINGAFLECVADPKGNWNLSVDVLWDGTLRMAGVTFNMGLTGDALDAFTLDTSVLSGGDQVVNKKRRIVGGGRRLSLVARNGAAGQNFSIARFLLHGRMGDER